MHPDAPARLTAQRWGVLPLGLGAGGLIALGHAPWHFWWLALFGLGVAAAVQRACATPGRAFVAGWLAGVGHFGLTLSWIVEPFRVDAATTGWMAPFAWAGIAAGLALFWGAAFWGATRLRPGSAMALVVAWTLAELARAWFFTGFPWALLSYIWAPTPAVQWLAVIGPFGLVAATVAVAALAAAASPSGPGNRRIAALSGAVGLFGALLAGGALLVAAPPALDGRPVVRLVQPNAPQHEKWDPARAPVFFRRQIEATASGPRPDLVVWPETALPTLLHNAGETLAVISEAAGPVPVVLGVQRTEAGEYYNSAILLGGDGAVTGLYDKHHLVPFGEYMPAAAFFARWNIAGLAARARGGYSAGPGPEILDLGSLGTALPLICYEAVFPRNIAGSPVRPDLLLQITNDAWFGSHSGPYQHLDQARMRAIEQGVPMLRAANTGVSAVIDASGRIVAQLPLDTAGHVDAPLPPPLPPTLYARTGDLPVWLVLALLGYTVFPRTRRDRR